MAERVHLRWGGEARRPAGSATTSRRARPLEGASVHASEASARPARLLARRARSARGARRRERTRYGRGRSVVWRGASPRRRGSYAGARSVCIGARNAVEGRSARSLRRIRRCVPSGMRGGAAADARAGRRRRAPSPAARARHRRVGARVFARVSSCNSRLQRVPSRSSAGCGCGAFERAGGGRWSTLAA